MLQEKKDILSRTFKEIFDLKGNEASLEQDIFNSWKHPSDVPNYIVSELIGAFKYRHWLAHGRYWEPKLGSKYDYHSIYTLGQLIVSSFPLEGQ